MLGDKNAYSSPSMAMVIKSLSIGTPCSSEDLDEAKKDKLQCSHCNGTRHTKETCFKIHGYSDWFLERRKQDKGNAYKRLAQAKLPETEL